MTGRYRDKEGSCSIYTKRRTQGKTKGILPQEIPKEQKGTQRNTEDINVYVSRNSNRHYFPMVKPRWRCSRALGTC